MTYKFLFCLSDIRPLTKLLRVFYFNKLIFFDIYKRYIYYVMEKQVKKRRDELLQQYWSYEDLPASKIPNSILGYWKCLLETETHWECKNIISCIIEVITEKKV